MLVHRIAGVILLTLCCSCASHQSRLLKPATLNRRAPEQFRARFETTKGPFTIEVHRDWAPLGADRFYNLVDAGFYDGQRFFRTLPKFVVQWGISPDPAVTKAWGAGTQIKDDPVKQSNKSGYVSFASRGPNTRTTAVYVNMADNARLDALGFAPFGRVAEPDMAVFAKLYSEYGEGAPRGTGPNQGKIFAEGEAYRAREFPRLDRIIRARVVRRRPWGVLADTVFGASRAAPR